MDDLEIAKAMQCSAAKDSAEARQYYETWRTEGYSSLEGLIFVTLIKKARMAYAAARALVRSPE